MEACPFTIGQEVYHVVSGSYGQERETCPVCYGKRSVVVVLGNDEQVPVMCENCRSGCDPPSGTVVVHRAFSRVEAREIKGVEMVDGGFAVHVGHSRPKLSDRVVFADKDEAEARRVELHAEAAAEAQGCFERNLWTARGKVSWTAGYHRAQVKDLKRKLEWHEAKLMAYKEAK